MYRWIGVLHVDIGQLLLGDFLAACRGYSEANGAKPKGKGSIDDSRLSALGIEGF